MSWHFSCCCHRFKNWYHCWWERYRLIRKCPFWIGVFVKQSWAEYRAKGFGKSPNPHHLFHGTFLCASVEVARRWFLVNALSAIQQCLSLCTLDPGWLSVRFHCWCRVVNAFRPNHRRESVRPLNFESMWHIDFHHFRPLKLCTWWLSLSRRWLWKFWSMYLACAQFCALPMPAFRIWFALWPNDFSWKATESSCVRLNNMACDWLNHPPTPPVVVSNGASNRHANFSISLYNGQLYMEKENRHLLKKNRFFVVKFKHMLLHIKQKEHVVFWYVEILRFSTQFDIALSTTCNMPNTRNVM